MGFFFTFPPEKQIESHPQMRVEYQYFPGNHYGFARFEYAKQLMSHIPMDYAIFVDDDERFPKDYGLSQLELGFSRNQVPNLQKCQIKKKTIRCFRLFFIYSQLTFQVERLWKIRQPKFYIGWYGYQLFADGDYWKPRDPNFKQLINAERLNVTKFDYRKN